MEKTATVMKHLTDVTGNRHLIAIPINQLSLVSVKNAVAELFTQVDRIDMVIGDAGSTSIPFFLTKDGGFANDFYLTYLSHFYLVELLLPKLRESHGRVIYTSGNMIDPYGKAFCSYLGLDPPCESLDMLDRVVHRFATPYAGTFAAYFMKTMHARVISLREKNVMAFAFQPGGVFTPGVGKMMTKKQEADLCTSLPYVNCLCGKNVSCPLDIFQGAVSPVYFAGCPAKELEKINGQNTVQCGWQAPHMDPFVAIQEKHGRDFAVAYAKQLQVSSWAWVKSTGVLNAASTATDSGFTASIAFVTVFMIGVSLGIVAILAKTSTVAPTLPESYVRLDSTL
jgi:NAD(P)-dependent dehydrogenase (short-subunit alcohol dehydrogenase family)